MRLIFFSLFAATLISCQKQLEECNSNCYPFIIRGQVLDMSKNIGISGIELKYEWINSGCYLCLDKLIDAKCTSSQGVFVFDNLIDTSKFAENYYLRISLDSSNKKNFIFSNSNFTISGIRDSKVTNLQFEFYPKTQLQIEIERTKKDTFETFFVHHAFNKRSYYLDCAISINERNNFNQIIKTETYSDIFTYIYWGYSINSQYTEFKDSIICKKGQINYYKIKY
jgi:hypothetical protein